MELDLPKRQPLDPSLRIALVVPLLADLANYRPALVRALLAAGAEVHAIGPLTRQAEALEDFGCVLHDWPLTRGFSNPAQELRSIASLRRLYTLLRPDVAHHFTSKPTIYGTLAARAARVPIRIATITGLGYTWIEGGLPATLLRTALRLGYQSAFRASTATLFLNIDDFTDLGQPRNATILQCDGGLDLERVGQLAISAETRRRLREELGLANRRVVLMVARLLRHKGVTEFRSAAREVSMSHPDVQFILAGPTDPSNPSAISDSELDDLAPVRYVGPRSDVPVLMAEADLVVLPSYREGLSHVLMEAAAMGLPLIAANVPGCREVIEDGTNGLLVPARDGRAVAAAIRFLLDNDALRSKMGAASRSRAEERFSSADHARSMLKVYANSLRTYNRIWADRLLEAAQTGGSPQIHD